MAAGLGAEWQVLTWQVLTKQPRQTGRICPPTLPTAPAAAAAVGAAAAAVGPPAAPPARGGRRLDPHLLGQCSLSQGGVQVHISKLCCGGYCGGGLVLQVPRPGGCGRRQQQQAAAVERCSGHDGPAGAQNRAQADWKGKLGGGAGSWDAQQGRRHGFARCARPGGLASARNKR